ncbi:hypothetical protein C1631_001805 [Chryseobacterium phosphatilyticum]|uniref:Uncharacterized protein n=1 Tax=Chryseobacterium phosphatilyticum TaxID=475075 RepID=A0A316XGS4_9FLAO|nr:hypothetical protein [Chryseobacterium phosphatilyticum]PWN71383.1 hypothetical protein C1631_001805 [Chryseobacterium phosphatilyticum]
MNSNKTILTGILFLAAVMAKAETIQTVRTPISPGEKWLAMTPILFFILVLFLVFIKLRKDKVSFKDLLLDKDAEVEIETQKTNQIATLVNTMQAAENLMPDAKVQINKIVEDIATGNETKNNSSISRFLAFISGLVSVGLASVITSFYMWNFFDDGKSLNLNELLTVLLSLGIGVIPYAFNKIGSAIK